MNTTTRSALTLIEIMIAISILAVVTSIACDGLRTMTTASGVVCAETAATNTVDRAVRRMIVDLRDAVAVQQLSATQIDFWPCAGFANDGTLIKGEQCEWLYDGATRRLVRSTGIGTARRRDDVVAQDLPTQGAVFTYDAVNGIYDVHLATAYSDAAHATRSREAETHVFRRTSVLPGTQISTPGTTPPPPADVVAPTLHASLKRSKTDINGTVSASAIGDVITSLTITDLNDSWAPTGALVGIGTTSASQQIMFSNMKNKPLTMYVTATTASGGTTTAIMSATANGDLTY